LACFSNSWAGLLRVPVKKSGAVLDGADIILDQLTGWRLHSIWKWQAVGLPLWLFLKSRAAVFVCIF